MNNTRQVVQTAFGDLAARWKEFIDEKYKDVDLSCGKNCQHGVRELDEILRGKKGEEIFQILAELLTCGLPDRVESAFWLLENYVLTHVTKSSLKSNYALLARIASAYAEFGSTPIVQVFIVLNF